MTRPFQSILQWFGIGCWAVAIALVGQAMTPNRVAAQNQSDADQNYQAMSHDEIAARCEAWIAEQSAENVEPWKQFAEAHSSLPATELIAAAVRLSGPELGDFVDRVRNASYRELLEAHESGLPAVNDPWIEVNFRCWFVDQLTQRQMYEEALEQLTGLDPSLLAEPAGYFFQKSVCAHQLLQKEIASESLKTLLTDCESLPTRYRMLGELMQQDMARWEDKSLDEISRKMKDVERRLDIGRSGQKVQKVEEEIIETLDELIAKLEQQASGGGGAGNSSQNNPSSPSQDSRVKGQTAPGEVDEKDLGKQAGWGNLPPKDQAKAKQILGTMFPPHYQRAIEAYNRKAAQRDNQNP
ncbi:hypothetical protein [Rubinisphaera margarita]|uniref:hypothetical protein n=1 Tax=Rubinisphaera margarita TaxID=2909586 RepID=UPI001EE9A831|nr:hypothetical protein [Rubinisphaera margarita]MCG6156299.1 hypothetical protein [Rubinisphaera margarita]